jgi:hypothetical protein
MPANSCGSCGDRLFAPQAGHKGADAVSAYNLAPLAAAKELGVLRVPDQVRTPQSIVRMADFNARGMGTSLGSLAILAMMGRPCHFRPIVEVPELPKIGSTCGLATQLPVRGSRWQLALAHNAASPVELVMAATTAERLTLIGDRCWQLGTAFGIAAVVPHFKGKFGHDCQSRRTGPPFFSAAFWASLSASRLRRDS